MTMKNRKGNLIVFSGPSGSGKGTILKELFDRYPDIEAQVSVSATTRQPRPGETDGVNYYFITKNEFESRIEQGGFYEYAQFCGNYYGTPKAEVLKKLDEGIDVILEIEVHGAMKIKEQVPDAVMVFVLPPSFKELRSSLINRATEPADVIDRRIATAQAEVEYIKHYTYVIINDKLESAVQQLKSVVEAEHLKVVKNTKNIQEVCKL
ncbi:MAG: guanylate kinase [Clostridia bacterium]|nr:guanylate kinase [Clostridia bacterium]